jgi:hypothetical protein
MSTSCLEWAAIYAAGTVLLFFIVDWLARQTDGGGA